MIYAKRADNYSRAQNTDEHAVGVVGVGEGYPEGYPGVLRLLPRLDRARVCVCFCSVDLLTRLD